MKKAIFALMSLVLVSAASPVFAADEMHLTVACQDARQDLRDAGYAVKITTGGIAGIPLATVWESTIAGPIALGTFPVQFNNRGMEHIYSARGFVLTIELESLTRTVIHPAHLRGKVKADLICKIYN